jgi:hypothetical protein
VAAKTAALEAAGERRGVTMMFCDVVEQPAFRRGSTPRSGATWSGRISTPAGGDRRTVVRTAWTSALKPSWGDVLELAGEDPDVIRDEVRVALGDYEAIFRAQEPNRRTRDQAADACRTLCRARVAEEFERHRETPIAEHLKLVLNVIDEHVR